MPRCGLGVRSLVLDYRIKGRKVSARDFFKHVGNEGIKQAMDYMDDKIHAAAASIIDPETGKHAEVIIRRTGRESMVLTTNGSPAFARELERRLGRPVGSIQLSGSQGPVVYLAHATEDKKALADPLARILMANGIEVWFDQWEIRSGDSLRQKMDEGLDKCTHFIVLLTETSIEKKWVNTEIDAGFMRDLDGQAKFIGLRSNLAVDRLSPLLRTKLCPDISITDNASTDQLIQDIFEHPIKPELGPTPSFVKTRASGLEGWSEPAVALARHLVLSSELARKYHGHTNIDSCCEAMGASEDDVRLGLLDLAGAGLVIRDEHEPDEFQPDIGLFVEFDSHFMDFNNRDDALHLAKRLKQDGENDYHSKDAYEFVSDWPIRRFNSALNVLEERKVIKADRYAGDSDFTCNWFQLTEELLRMTSSS